MTAAGGDRGDNTAPHDETCAGCHRRICVCMYDKAPVEECEYPRTPHCICGTHSMPREPWVPPAEINPAIRWQWPGGRDLNAVPAADRQTDEERTGPAWRGTVLESCIRDVARGRIASHSSVTPELIAEWREFYGEPDPARPAVADAVMADPITEGVTEARLREAVARELFRRQSPEHGWGAGLAYEAADELLALDEMRALLGAAAKVQRVEALVAQFADPPGLATAMGAIAVALRAALGGEG